MDIWLNEPVADFDGGDVQWTFDVLDGDGAPMREKRAGVRLSGRALVIGAAEQYLHGDWTPALVSYAAAALQIAPATEGTTWVTASNFPEIHSVVEAHRQSGTSLFHSGSVEGALQFGEPDGNRRLRHVEVHGPC